MADLIHDQRIPDAVQQAFQAVSTFQLPNSEDALFRERIHINAEREAHSKTALFINENGLTGGMLSACVDPVRVILDEFKKQSGKFDIAIRPHLSKINGINDRLVPRPFNVYNTAL